MTTIVCNRESIAADTLMCDESVKTYGTKIIETPHAFIGIAGYMADFHRFAKWFNDPRRFEMPEKDWPDVGESCFLILYKNGSIALFEGCHYVPVEMDYYAIGSGAQSGMTAMRLGCTPEEAVKVACEVDPYTGGDVVVRCLEKPHP